MNVYVENISKNSNKTWRPIYKFIDNSFFAATKLFTTKFLYQCENNPNEPQDLPSEVKVALKHGYGTGVICTSGYDTPKGFREKKVKIKYQEI